MRISKTFFSKTILFALAVSLSLFPKILLAQDANAEANKLFVEAVTLFHDSSSSAPEDKNAAYTKVRALFDRIVSDYPASKPAAAITKGGAPAGVVLADLPASFEMPVGWNDGTRGIARDLLAAYSNDLDRLQAVAEATDYAILSWAAYEQPESLDAAKKAGWQPFISFFGKSLVGGDALATVFVGPEDQHVLAFRGSVTGKDWITNTLGTVLTGPLVTDQVQDAARIAQDAKKLFPDISFTGHSLGGRLAKVAALSTGGKAFAFNSAPLGANELLRFGVKLTTKNEIHRFRSPQDPVSQILPQSDLEVSNIVEANFFSALKLKSIKDYTHAMGVLVQAMISVELAWSEGWIEAYRYEQGDYSGLTRTSKPQLPKPEEVRCMVSTVTQCSSEKLCEKAVVSQKFWKAETSKNIWAKELDARGETCSELNNLIAQFQKEAQKKCQVSSLANCSATELCVNANKTPDTRTSPYFKEMERRGAVCPSILEQVAKFDAEQKCRSRDLDKCSNEQLCTEAINFVKKYLKDGGFQSAYYAEMVERNKVCSDMQKLISEREKRKPNIYYGKFSKTIKSLDKLPEYEGVYIRVGDQVEKLRKLNTYFVTIRAADLDQQLERVEMGKLFSTARNNPNFSAYGKIPFLGITMTDYQESVHLGSMRKNGDILIPRDESISLVTVGKNNFDIAVIDTVASVQEMANTVKRIPGSRGLNNERPNRTPGMIEYMDGVKVDFLAGQWGYALESAFNKKFLSEFVTEYDLLINPCKGSEVGGLYKEKKLHSYGLIVALSNGDKYLFSCLSQSLAPWTKPDSISMKTAREVFDEYNAPFKLQ